MVVGGQAPKAIRSVECYDFEEQRWYQVAELPTRRCRAGRKPSVIIINELKNVTWRLLGLGSLILICLPGFSQEKVRIKNT